MLSSAHVLTPKPAALPPAGPPALPGSGCAGGPSFSQFLNDQPDLLPPPAHPDPVPVRPDTAESPPESAAAPAPAANSTAARRNQAAPASKPASANAGRAPDAAGPSKPGEDALARDGGGATVDAAAAEPATDEAADVGQAPETAGLNEFTQLIGLAQPVVPTPAGQAGMPVAAAGVDVTANAQGVEPAIKGAQAGRVADEGRELAPGANAQATGVGEANSTSAGERRPADRPARAADAPRAKGIELAADKAGTGSNDRAGSTDALQAAASPSASGAHAATAADIAAPSFAAVLAQALPTVAAADASAPASTGGQVQAPLHSSAFASEMGARVSLLAVDGVQSAELQLNPTDMGPVSVQIVVDGAQAQVSFHAAQAETRQALEQSLPDLAAALQSQGLTLSGGGVFQQASRDSRGGGGTDDGGGDRRGSRAGLGGGRIGAAPGATASPARRTVGLLDTFA